MTDTTASPLAPNAACELCGNTHKRTLHHIAGYDIQQCDACGFAHIHPFPARAARAAFYAGSEVAARKEKKKRGPLKRLAAVARHWLRKMSGRTKGTVFLRELTRRLPAGSRVLDIGCGTGAFLATARTRYQCTGIEISDDLAALARELGVEVLVGDFCEFPFGARRFDAIAMVSLLEHLHQPLAALRQCHALLANGGLLLLKTVNHGGLNRRLMGANWSGYRPPDHLVYFDPASLTRALEAAGFHNIQIRASLLNDSFYCYAVRDDGSRSVTGMAA